MKNDNRVVYTRPESGNAVIQRTNDLLNIGAEAWASAMPQRANQMDRMFDGTTTEKFRQVASDYNDFAKNGALVVAYYDTNDSWEPVGYAMAKNDVSGSLVSRALKSTIARRKIYAWVAQINVIPEFQGQGIGTGLLKDVLSEFPSTRIPSAYIFAENPRAKEWFEHKGFSLNPNPQAPREDVAYKFFGEDNPRVDQFRFTAPSVAAVLRACYKS